MKTGTGRALLIGTLAATLLLGGGSVASAQASPGSTAAIHGNTAHWLISNSTNLGAAAAGEQVNLLIGLNYLDPSGLASFITATVNPVSPYFHQYLTPTQFASTYDQSRSSVAALKAYLQGFGITPTATFSNRIEAVGNVGQVEQALSVSINAYQFGGHSYFANQESPSLPTSYSYGGFTYNLAAMVSGVSGLMTYNGIHTMTVSQSQLPAATGSSTCQIDCKAPVGYSPQQIDSAYNVPTKLTGRGTTIAIATLAPFYNKDAQAFWSYYKIKRTGSLSQVSVDQASTNTSGKGQGGSESSLDVERSGAMAPGANIVAYIAPNTNNGFVDLFNTVATQNQAQVMTTSWGLAEQDETQGYATLLNQAFEQGAAEGISMFAASGDYGAYDGYPQYKSLAVDSPASSTYITAVGGTTLPQSSAGVALTSTLNVGPTSEAAWGWSYLVPYYKQFGEPSAQRMQQLVYPIGSGGGYSLYFQEPSWQTGFQSSGQRGMPDVALNADPFTGYAIYDSSSAYSNNRGPWTNGWGGTSFAAPQWAGITALLDQATGGPIGLATGVFYHLPPVSGGTVAGFRDITQGNNWGYQASVGWDPTTGLGVPDVGQLADAISAYDSPTTTKATGKP
ncbi:MAG: S53 family peptidase [Candidatus Dormibacteria bacterium]